MWQLPLVYKECRLSSSESLSALRCLLHWVWRQPLSLLPSQVGRCLLELQKETQSVCWDLEPGSLAGNPETWQDMDNGCSQWVSFTAGGLREPCSCSVAVGKNKDTKQAVYQRAPRLWWSQICTEGVICSSMGVTHLSAQ